VILFTKFKYTVVIRVNKQEYLKATESTKETYTYSALHYIAIGMVITQGRWSGWLSKSDDREAFGTESKLT